MNALNRHRNFIWDDKYKNKDPEKYESLHMRAVASGGQESETAGNTFEDLSYRFSRGMSSFMSFGSGEGRERSYGDSELPKIQLTRRYGFMEFSCALVGLTKGYSACKWSSGHDTEHSIANAYADAITNAKHCIYIENQVPTSPSAPC